MSTTTVTYSDKEYTIKKMNPFAALGVLVKLRKIMGNDVAEAFGGLKDKTEEEVGISIALGLTSGIEEAELIDLLNSLFKHVIVTDDKGKSRRADANLDFASLEDMLMVGYECVKHNFSDFLSGFLPSSN